MESYKVAQGGLTLDEWVVVPIDIAEVSEPLAAAIFYTKEEAQTEADSRNAWAARKEM